MKSPPPSLEGETLKSSAKNLISLRTGIAWNVLALGFLAIAGVVLNLSIRRFYNPDILGLFNIIFAIFILTSQLATFGLQLATLQAVSNDWEDMNAVSLSLRSAFIGATMINMIVVPMAFLATPLIANLYDQIDNIAKAWIIVVPGLYFSRLIKFNWLQSTACVICEPSRRFKRAVPTYPCAVGGGSVSGGRGLGIVGSFVRRRSASVPMPHSIFKTNWRARSTAGESTPNDFREAKAWRTGFRCRHTGRIEHTC